MSIVHLFLALSLQGTNAPKCGEPPIRVEVWVIATSPVRYGFEITNGSSTPVSHIRLRTGVSALPSTSDIPLGLLLPERWNWLGQYADETGAFSILLRTDVALPPKAALRGEIFYPLPVAGVASMVPLEKTGLDASGACGTGAIRRGVAKPGGKKRR